MTATDEENARLAGEMAWGRGSFREHQEGMRRLVEIGGPLAIRYLAPLLDSSYETQSQDDRPLYPIRLNAIEALGRVGGAAAAEALVPALKSDVRTQYAAIKAFRTIGASAVEPLGKALKAASDFEHRSRVAEALEAVGDHSATIPLAEALWDASYLVRSVAAQALQGLRWEPSTREERLQFLCALGQWEQVGRISIEKLITAMEDYSGKAIPEALAAIGPPAVEALVAALNHPSEQVRLGAARALRANGGPHDSAREPLLGYCLRALRDRDWNSRAFAARTLGELGDAGAVVPLIDALSDGYPIVENRAVEALGRLGDVRAFDALMDRATSADRVVRDDAMLALQQLGASALEPVLAWVRLSRTLPDQPMRLVVSMGAGVLKPLLEAYGDEEGEVKRFVGQAIEKISRGEWTVAEDGTLEGPSERSRKQERG